MMPTLIFQNNDLKGASEHIYSNRAKGVVSAAFVYSEKKADSNVCWGTLYVGMPENYGISEIGHNAIKARFHIAVFRQREQIAFGLKDTEIEDACELLFDAINPY